jgi:hypothetical protein
MGVNSFKELIVYQKAHKLAMDIFHIAKKFPREEQYSSLLTYQSAAD